MCLKVGRGYWTSHLFPRRTVVDLNKLQCHVILFCLEYSDMNKFEMGNKYFNFKIFQILQKKSTQIFTLMVSKVDDIVYLLQMYM